MPRGIVLLFVFAFVYFKLILVYRLSRDDMKYHGKIITSLTIYILGLKLKVVHV